MHNHIPDRHLLVVNMMAVSSSGLPGGSRGGYGGGGGQWEWRGDSGQDTIVGRSTKSLYPPIQYLYQGSNMAKCTTTLLRTASNTPSRGVKVSSASIYRYSSTLRYLRPHPHPSAISAAISPYRLITTTYGTDTLPTTGRRANGAGDPIQDTKYHSFHPRLVVTRPTKHSPLDTYNHHIRTE